MKAFKMIYLNKIRTQQPLIHNISNTVAASFTANGLLALGASPMMADSPAEVAELAAKSQALVLNLGAPSEAKIAAMLAAGIAANQANVPVVFDPVAVSGSLFRREAAATLLRQIHFTAIRGNAAEMAYLAGVDWQAKGVDAGLGSCNLAHIAQIVAEKWACVAIVSGQIDWVSDGKQLARLENGVDLLPKITASGCLLSAVVGAFLAVAPRENSFQAAAEAVAVYTVAGELAAQDLSPTQSGTFAWKLLDALAAVSAEQVAQLVHLQQGN